MKNFLFIFVLFLLFFSDSHASGKFQPIKNGEKANFDGILIDISAASSIITMLKNNTLTSKKTIELSNELCEEKIKLVESVKETKTNVLTDIVKNENENLLTRNKQLYSDNKKLENKNKIKNYIIIILLSSTITYQLIN